MKDREPLDVIDAIFSTRAMRYLKPDPIPDEVLWAVLDAAIRGPTGGNMQSWAWIVVRDPDKRQAIGRWYREGIEASYGGRMEEASDSGRVMAAKGMAPTSPQIGLDRKNYLAVMHLAEHFEQVPALVYGVLPEVRRRSNDPDAAFMNGVLSAGPILGAVQNLMLAARAHGVGTVLNSGGAVRNHEELRQLLNLPEGSIVCACVALGYPAKGKFSTPKRRPIEELTHWESWGEQRPQPHV